IPRPHRAPRPLPQKPFENRRANRQPPPAPVQETARRRRRPTKMVRLSNTMIGILNAITFLLSVPILAGGIWLRARADGTECERYLAAPVIVLGVFLMLVSIAGLVGACCRVTCLLWFYLVAMFLLIVVLLGITVFAFVVTHKGTGEAVSGRGFKEYRLGDYSTWLQRRVENDRNWNRIRGCLQDAKVCKSLEDRRDTVQQFMSSDLSPIQVIHFISCLTITNPR
uniref:Uncharacterized protein n=1 Tax=Aegilops tauschii subsp. strangulata TaxID=200361 RepID=A0A453KWF0_AEGTS